MKEERPDASLFIGLHKLAEQNGDGLVPELYELLSRRSHEAGEDGNVVVFPSAARANTPAIPGSKPGKVLPFDVKVGQRR